MNNIYHALTAKKFITLLLALVASVGTLFAENGTCGENLTWDLTDGVLTISGTGDMTNWSYSSVAPWSKTSIVSVIISDGVTSIGNYAFYNCSSLTSIEIPNSVTSIGNYAFDGCKGLTSFTIPNSVTSIGMYAFVDCSGLTSITIPNSVTSIGYQAFYHCSGLTSITIPNSVTSIGLQAFAGCSGLTSIIVEEGNPVYDSRDNCNALIVTSTNTLTVGCQNTIIPNSVTSIGNQAFDGCKGLTSFTIPNSVTSIGSCAFDGCSNLTSIEIPNSVTSIRNRAFANCFKLISIDIPENIKQIENNTFDGCSGLTSINIPNSVTSIGDYAFYHCSGLTSIEIPNSVTSIGNSAFYSCTGLRSIINHATNRQNISSDVFSKVNKYIPLYVPAESVEVYKAANYWKEFLNIQAIPGAEPCLLASGTCGADGDNLTWELTCGNVLTINGTGKMADYKSYSSVPWYSYYAYILDVIISDDVTSIGNYAFVYCYSVTSIDLPNSVTSIGDNAFYGCSGITSINIPNSVTSIGEGAFDGCKGLTSINIPNSVTSIGSGAFSGCTALTSVEIPNSVTSIGRYLFPNCTALTDVVVEAGNSKYDSRENCNAIIETSTNTLIAGCKNTIIPNSITSIGERAFTQCSGPTSIEIPNSVTSIGVNAFSNCRNLKSIEIPNSVINIESGAFGGCTALKSITNHATTPQTIDSYVFSSVNKSIPLYVPTKSIDAYKAAYYWKDFTNIQAIQYTVTFKNWDGTELAQVTVSQGEAATPPTDPTRDHYTFTGWDKDFSNVTEDMTVTALYDINYYPITFLNWNGALLSQQSVAYNQAAGAPEVPTREGYIFKGWTADIEHVIGQTFAIALFEKEGIDITYKAEDGDVLFTEQADLHIPVAPGISGKTFSGWLTEVADNTNGIVLRATYTTDNPTTDDDVKVEPSSTTADVSFPYITGAVTYMLVILDMSDVIVCKIMFGADGRLLGIALAPGRNRSQQQAQTEGFRFTVEGLTESTTYKYEFVAHDESDAVIETLSGSFTTTPNIATGAPSVKDQTSSTGKLIQNGHLLIQRGEKVYSADGQELR